MRGKTFLCIGMSLLTISVHNTVWEEETVWETSNDGANEQWGESQTDSSQAVETQQENWHPLPLRPFLKQLQKNLQRQHRSM